MKRRPRHPTRTKPTLALSMIVKDGEATLDRCLASVRGVVDEIVVADTGSSDRTVDICARHGAKVIAIPWENDFAKARNASLGQVRSDWVLVLDDDELLDDRASVLIPPLLRDPHVMAYSVTIRNYIFDREFRMWDRPPTDNVSPPPFAAAYPAYLEHTNTRLFRRHPDLFFEGCVHESVTYRAVRLGMKTVDANFLIHHLGFADDGNETNARKAVYYRALGREKLRAMPDHAPAHFELGLEEFQRFHNYEVAEGLFRRAAELDPRLGVAWYFYGKSLLELGRHREAVEAFERAEETDARKENVFEAEGDAHFALGEIEQARERYGRVIKLGVRTPELESKLGFAEVRAGDAELGLSRLREAAKRSRNPVVHDRLTTACVWVGDIAGAAEAAESLIEAVGQHPRLFLRAASLRAKLCDAPRAAELLRRGLSLFPKDEKLRQAAAEIERQPASAYSSTGTNGSED